MLDLNKYLNRAVADLEFKKRLVENANQAIKDEFGENLPYQLKCKEKLIFEIETTDGMAESDLEGVAGGAAPVGKVTSMPAEEFKKMMEAKGYCVSHYLDGNRTYFGCRLKAVPGFRDRYYAHEDENGNLWVDFKE